ncbi:MULTISPECIES: outer membrane beta-barrel protein [Flavobacteriaceae]|uniref:outer membrane beta-barrel protein n=1 Tax=Flavobacteriaceae TaxID=49546 RepID=UPI001490C452|nr:MULTISPECIES: outer membrane beta-barrel protein [Allomuricauda]MDC6367661.1 outer membrane beta-barrel protein [Muricauda sp. AC10]
MKKVFLAIIIMASVVQFSNAQEQNKFRVGLDLGYAMPDGGGGVLIALEPKYNIAANMNIGLRIESAAMAKNISAAGLSVESKLAASQSFTGTFDYYFNSGTSSFAPFLGAGVGYSSLANIEVEFAEIEGSAKAEVDGKFGGLIRAGFELGKLRLAATYNLIGKSEIEDSEIKNSYLGISLGFYVGGGKWKK